VRSEGGKSPDGFDLDHHLVPDPVGKALACLLERVRVLENKLAEAGLVPDEEPEENCDGCECGGILTDARKQEAAIRLAAGMVCGTTATAPETEKRTHESALMEP